MRNDEIIIKLEEQNSALSEELKALKLHIDNLYEQIRIMQNQRFGAKSEKTVVIDDGQLSMFNEAETTADESKPEPELKDVCAYKRAKKKGKREEDLSGLETEQIFCVLPEEEQVCPECGGKMHECGHSVYRKELKFIPAKLKVVEYVQTAYSCRKCEETVADEPVPMKKAEVPKPVVSGSGVASASLIAGIAHSKYTMALPLYRQEQEFNRLGYKISRQTMANWLIYAYEHYLKAVVSSMKEKLLEHTVLHADETTVQVLHEDEKAPQSKSYMWLFRTSGDSKTPMAIYEYQPDRKHCRPAEFLENWTGFLHCDGYEAYHKLPGVTPVGCLAHVRRKFFEAKMALHPDKRENSLADKGLKYCDKLFKLEKKFAYYSPENNFKARFEGRQKESKPLFDEFFVWAESLNALPQTAIGKAVSYALNEKKYVENYLSDGRLEISNNRAERSIKPFVIGRKNWLFSDSVRGANTSAAFYSLIISATENGLNPMKYLAFLLDTAANSDLSVPANIENLLPWNAPDSCKLPKSKPENFPWEEDDEIAKIRRGKDAAN